MRLFLLIVGTLLWVIGLPLHGWAGLLFSLAAIGFFACSFFADS